MMLPHVEHLLRDDTRKLTFRVMAYRKLSRIEVLESVRAYHAQPKVRRRKRALRNATITVLTLYGASPGL